MRDRLTPYLPRLFGYAVSLTLNRDEARDLVQDCAVRVLEARRIPADEPAFRAWLFKIVRNRFLDQRRREGRAPMVSVEEIPQHSTGEWDADRRLINTVSVRVGMRKLAPPHREIIALVDVAGFSYGEAASILDVPAGTVMSRLSRARRALMDEVSASNIHELTPSARGYAQ